MADNAGRACCRGELIVAIVALVVSIGALAASIVVGNGTNSIAREALATARAANMIALGETESHPVVSVGSLGGQVEILELEAIPSRSDFRDHFISIRNRGSVTIAGARIEMYAMSGLVYSRQLPWEEYHKVFPSEYLDLNLEEILQPDDSVLVDVLPWLVTYMRNLDVDYATPDGEYTAVVCFSILPRRDTDDLVVKDPSSETIVLVTVHYAPAILDSADLSELPDPLEPEVRFVY